MAGKSAETESGLKTKRRNQTMRERDKGFVAGLLTAALALGLGGAAAAGRSVRIEDGLGVTINGVPFIPRDANGKQVELFASEGTTYAPVRALAEAVGLRVEYDAATRTVRLESGDYAAQGDPRAGDYIGVDRAKQLALADAGVDAGAARILKACLDWENGAAVYEVEFCALNSEYDYELDAVTGKVLSKELELDNFDWAGHDDRHNGHGSSGAASAGLISEARAREIALARLPGGRVTKCELDNDDGVWVYELELRGSDSYEYECELSAADGTFLKWERDY